MDIEVEAKYRVDDLAEIDNKLKAMLGVGYLYSCSHVDTYYNSLLYDMKSAKETLRVRFETGFNGRRKELCLKRPAPETLHTKNRIESEIELYLDSDIETILVGLRYVEAGKVIKHRKIYTYDTVTDNSKYICIRVCLDTVENLGTFVELEAIEAEDRIQDAQEQIALLASKLELHNLEKRGYLALLLETNKG